MNSQSRLLSPVESIVLRLIFEGLNSHAIANQLVMEHDDVRSHIRAIMGKLDMLANPSEFVREVCAEAS